jgi:uncharacterized protein YkwD
MARDSARRVRRVPAVLLVAAALVAAAWLAIAANPSLVAANAACAHRNAGPGEASLAELRRSLTCLINDKRHDRDRQRLDRNRKLQRAAQRHTRVMVKKDCFEHRCEGEPGFTRRVRQTGYLQGAEEWAIAENLGYENTPREMLRRFLRKRFTRQNMLKPKFRDIGVGVDWGTPDPDRNDSKFATYTVVFGWRHR